MVKDHPGRRAASFIILSFQNAFIIQQTLQRFSLGFGCGENFSQKMSFIYVCVYIQHPMHETGKWQLLFRSSTHYQDKPCFHFKGRTNYHSPLGAPVPQLLLRMCPPYVTTNILRLPPPCVTLCGSPPLCGAMWPLLCVAHPPVWLTSLCGSMWPPHPPLCGAMWLTPQCSSLHYVAHLSVWLYVWLTPCVALCGSLRYVAHSPVWRGTKRPITVAPAKTVPSTLSAQRIKVTHKCLVGGGNVGRNLSLFAGGGKQNVYKCGWFVHVRAGNCENSILV